MIWVGNLPAVLLLRGKWVAGSVVAPCCCWRIPLMISGLHFTTRSPDHRVHPSCLYLSVPEILGAVLCSSAHCRGIILEAAGGGGSQQWPCCPAEVLHGCCGEIPQAAAVWVFVWLHVELLGCVLWAELTPGEGRELSFEMFVPTLFSCNHKIDAAFHRVAVLQFSWQWH